MPYLTYIEGVEIITKKVFLRPERRNLRFLAAEVAKASTCIYQLRLSSKVEFTRLNVFVFLRIWSLGTSRQLFFGLFVEH